MVHDSIHPLKKSDRCLSALLIILTSTPPSSHGTTEAILWQRCRLPKLAHATANPRELQSGGNMKLSSCSGSRSYMALKRYALLIAFCFIPTSLFSNKLYFPQLVFGGGYTTTIVLLNKGTTSVSSDFLVYGERGALLRSIPTTVHGPVSPRPSLADPGPSIVSSWGMLDAGTETVQGAATFEVRSTTGALIATAGVLGVEAANDFTFPVDVAADGIASNTGFAVANVNPTSDVTVNFQLLSELGCGDVTGADARSITLRSGQHIAEFVTEVWLQLGAPFKGTLLVWVTPGQPNSLVLTALNLKDGLMSALPVISGVVNDEVLSAINAGAGCWDY